MTDEELRRAYQAGTSARPMGRRECPGVEAIAALVEREGKEADRLALLDHIMACSACRGDFELLRSAHLAAPAASQRRFRLLALAASIALLVGLGAMGLWSRLRIPQPDIRRASGGEVELVAPSSGAVLNLPLQLAWHPVRETTVYTVELLTDGGRLLRSWETTDTTVSVPVSAPEPQAGRYAWWVRARLRDGTERRSPVVRFDLR
jgi:hypothetical protein